MITARECQYDEVKKFRNLEGEYHYMGESHKSVAIGAFAISAKVAFGDEEAAATAGVDGVPRGQAPVSPLVFASSLHFSHEYAILLPFLGKDAVVAVGCKGEPWLLRMRSLWSQGDEKGRCGCRRCVALA